VGKVEVTGTVRNFNLRLPVTGTGNAVRNRFG